MTMSGVLLTEAGIGRRSAAATIAARAATSRAPGRDPAAGSEVRAQHHVGIEHRDEPFEVPVAAGREVRVDDLALDGFRQGELLALRWRGVDWPSRRVRVRLNYVRGRWGTPKSKRGSGSVPMADRVGAELELHFRRTAYSGDDDLVSAHPHTGGVIDHSQLVRRFKKALAASGVRAVRFNDLRHAFGTRMAATGVPPRTLQEWMGHRDIKTTQIYADYQPDDRREAELVEQAFSRGPNSGGLLEPGL